MNGMYQDITLYHKTQTGCKRYNLIASVRHTSIINRTKTGKDSVDSGVIRIFDAENEPYQISKDDVIVGLKIMNDIETKDALLTELQKLCGKDKVFKIKSIDVHRYKDLDLFELNHIKIGII